MATLKASEQGKKRIQQARNDKGWTVDDPRWLVEASKILEPDRNWEVNSELFANGVSEGTWKAFLYRQRGIDTKVFKAYCKVIEVPWEEVKEVSQTSVMSQGNPDWQTICSQMLNDQKQHLRQQVTQIGCEVDVYVPLGLVERKHQSKRRDNYSLPPEQGSGFFQPTEEEIIQTYQHDEFLKEVIQKGQSKKSKGKRIAIIGEPGAGKTTILQQIAFSKETPGFPIWISLKSLGEKSLEKYLCENWLKGALKTSDITQQQKDLEGLFKSGEVLLILDGVDEMPASSPVEALGKIREELTGWVVDARIVLTCRVNVWEASVNSLQGFDIYRTLDFSYGDGDKQDQVKQFICDWFIKAEKPERGETLREKLDEDRHQRIRDLVKNPLRLSLLCQSWYFKQGDLPETKAMLYEQFTRAFYEWKKEVFQTTLTKRKKLNTALGLLAREAIDLEKSRFAIRESFAVDVMGEDLFNLACKLHWLVEVYKDADTGEKIYAFFHPTFQEYFAACAIEDWHYFLNHIPNNPPVDGYRIFEPQWKEVYLLWLGKEVDKEFRKQKEAFIKALVEFEDGCKERLFNYKGFYEYRAYFLAAAGIAEFKDSQVSDDIVRQLIKWSIGTDFQESSLPKQTVKQLVQNGLRQIHAPFNIIKKAETVLKETDCLRVINVLIELIRTTCVKDIRHKAIEILGEFGMEYPELKQVFIELINNSPDDYSRIKAAKSLGKFDPSNQQLLATLVDFVHNSIDNYIVCEAGYILSTIAPNHPESGRIAEPSLLLEAVKAGRIDPNDPQLHQLIINKARSSPDGWMRQDIIRDLGYIVPSGHSEAIKLLIEIIQTSTDEGVIFEAVRSLARIGKNDPETIRLLIELIRNSKDASIRYQAVIGLRHIQTSYEEVIGLLIDIIRTVPRDFDCDEAAQCLGHILKQYPLESAVSALKNFLITLEPQTDLRFYDICYNDTLGECAQTMSYPAYYKAWHNDTSTVEFKKNTIRYSDIVK